MRRETTDPDRAVAVLPIRPHLPLQYSSSSFPILSRDLPWENRQRFYKNCWSVDPHILPLIWKIITYVANVVYSNENKPLKWKDIINVFQERTSRHKSAIRVPVHREKSVYTIDNHQQSEQNSLKGKLFRGQCFYTIFLKSTRLPQKIGVV